MPMQSCGRQGVSFLPQVPRVFDSFLSKSVAAAESVPFCRHPPAAKTKAGANSGESLGRRCRPDPCAVGINLPYPRGKYFASAKRAGSTSEKWCWIELLGAVFDRNADILERAASDIDDRHRPQA
jgi:hypothetical protein